MLFLSRCRLAIAGFVFTLLAACSGSSDPAVVADFSINGVKGTVSGQNVTIDLTTKESCSNLPSLVTSVQANGATVSPDPTVARDYSKPVDFTITAPDGTKVVYTVTVKGNACNDAEPTPTACTAAPIGSTGYSLVFKGCDAANVATYYDKTECVRDNTTGLIWQGHTPAGTGLRANDQYKTNFDSTTELQKYNGGRPIAPTQTEIDATTNSIGFKNAVNATSLCGSSAWRMPTKDELLGIVKMNAAAPMIDTDWFPNTPQNSFYWTSSPYAGYAYVGWVVDFFYGDTTDDYRDGDVGDDGYLVRLVR